MKTKKHAPKKQPHPAAAARRDLTALRRAWITWRAEGMTGAEPVSPMELDRRINLLGRAIRHLPAK